MKLRKDIIAAAALLAGLTLLGGCASSGSSTDSWTWTPAPAPLDAGTVRANPANAVVQPSHGFRVVQGSEYAPEYSRRDAKLGSVYTNPYESWMGWPSESRPTLDRRGTYTTSRSAERYSYPRIDDRKDHSSRRGNGRGHRHGTFRRVR